MQVPVASTLVPDVLLERPDRATEDVLLEQGKDALDAMVADRAGARPLSGDQPGRGGDGVLSKEAEETGNDVELSWQGRHQPWAPSLSGHLWRR